MAWTPINDTPADKATFTLGITASKDQTVAANGQLISRLENPDKTATSTYRINTPTTTYMLVFAVGDFLFDDVGTIDGVHYRNFLSRTTSDTFTGYIHQAPKIMKYLVDRLGKYPFDEFGVLTTNTFPSGGALETQSLISMRPAYYNQDASEDTIGEQETLAHEMAHQWFGALVTYKDHGQTFLHEGFAEYFGFTYINDTLNSNYLQERFVSIYPRLVAGQWTYKQSKSDFLESMRNYFGYRELSQEKVGIILDGFFGSSLLAENRQRILERVKAGFQPSDLANVLEELQFTRVIFTAKTYSEILNLLGQSYSLDFLEQTRLTPPGKFANDDYVLNIGVYFRGAMTLHALRLKTGDELFFKILRTYLERYKFSNATNQDFVNIVNELAGTNTKAFLESWLYDDNVPNFPEMNLYTKDFQLGADFK